jgi:hypothetical protein
MFCSTLANTEKLSLDLRGTGFIEEREDGYGQVKDFNLVTIDIMIDF